MPTIDSAFSGSIPELYDRFLGPLLFLDYAEDLAARLADAGACDLLEVAAGTGIVTRSLARRIPGARLTATDLNQAMLDRAAAQGTPAGVTWKQADAQSLPFADGTFDALACQFGVMFFPDKPGAYSQAKRVLRPGGRFVFNVWDRLSNNVLSQVVSEALSARYPKDPPGFLDRTPFGYFDIDTIRGALTAAGFSRVEVETVSKRSRAASAREVAIGLCQGTPLRGEIEAREPAGLAAATDAAEQWLIKQCGAGPVDAPMQAHVFVARA